MAIYADGSYERGAQRTRIPTIAAVVLVHVGLGYALVSGLASTAFQKINDTFTVENIPLPAPAVEPLPPEPAKKLTPVDRADVPTRTVTLPQQETLVDLSPMPIESAPVIYANPAPPVAIDSAPPVAAPPQESIAAKARGDRAGWITSDDYPMSALRAAESGIVGIQAAIDHTGRVLACKVTASSGSAALDAATCRLYQKRGRYTPARDGEGNALATTVTDRIRWRLPE